MNLERLYQVLLGPYTTEKTVRAADKNNQIAFKVARDANKLEIKHAVEKLFKVAVNDVRVVNVKGKSKTFKQQKSKKRDWKKAFVALKEGHDINWSEIDEIK